MFLIHMHAQVDEQILVKELCLLGFNAACSNSTDVLGEHVSKSHNEAGSSATNCMLVSCIGNSSTL
jgi:hypothetical protein